VSGCAADPHLVGVSGSLDALHVTTTTTTPTTTEPPALTLEYLVGQHFQPEDRDWALRVAWCESRGAPESLHSDAQHAQSRASGWFQHLPKFWEERSTAAGVPGADIFDSEAQVIVAAYLLYQTPQGSGHWYPSEHCWS